MWFNIMCASQNSVTHVACNKMWPYFCYFCCFVWRITAFFVLLLLPRSLSVIPYARAPYNLIWTIRIHCSLTIIIVIDSQAHHFSQCCFRYECNVLSNFSNDSSWIPELANSIEPKPKRKKSSRSEPIRTFPAVRARWGSNLMYSGFSRRRSWKIASVESSAGYAEEEDLSKEEFFGQIEVKTR